MLFNYELFFPDYPQLASNNNTGYFKHSSFAKVILVMNKLVWELPIVYIENKYIITIHYEIINAALFY